MVKNYDEQNKKIWSSVIEKDVMLYPNERVVAFLARNYPNIEENKETRRGFDIGFGSGRHLKLLMDYGFEAHGIDYSESSVDTVKSLFGSNVHVKLANLDDVKYTEFYDVVLMFGVAFLRPEEEIKKDLERVNKFLKKNGKLFINFRTKEDFLYKQGKQLARNTYLLENQGVYSGLTYTFLDKEEAVKLLQNADFKVELIERDDYWKNNLKEHNSWWVITAQKIN
ncbi:class I SAM-dependent methyltransferase [Lysinibacillus sp. FSL K6-4013]|uniref:class I SAM-dependent methyltransferase n=1 Tax=unclassified Lysinibacillus TaxID=2636778 RepID=UPI003159BDE7